MTYLHMIQLHQSPAHPHNIHTHNHLETSDASDSMLGQMSSNLAKTIGTGNQTEIPATMKPATPWHQHHITLDNTKRRRFRSSTWPVKIVYPTGSDIFRPTQWNDHTKTVFWICSFYQLGRHFQLVPNHIHGQQPMLKSLKWKHQRYKWKRCMTQQKSAKMQSLHFWLAHTACLSLYFSEFSHPPFLRRWNML